MTPGRLRITYLAPFVPFATIPHAGGQFFHRYLLWISKAADVTVVAPGSQVNREAAAAPDVTPVDVHLVPVRPRPRTKLGYLPRLVANTAAGLTPGWQVLEGFRDDEDVWSLVRASALVELQWPWYLAFVPDVRRVAPDVPVTAFEHDVLTESLARRARHGLLHERTFGRFAARRTRTKEPALLNLCNTVFAFSERDAASLRNLGVTRPLVVVDPPVQRQPDAGPPGDPPTALFVGAMDRPENSQGAEWLAGHVWPRVERKCPSARLVLAGSSPPPGLARRNAGSVSVTGFVPDLGPLYGAATVFVAPNLTGAGVKFKVLDAMSHGLPVVATPIAAEGIVEGAPDGAFAAITADPDGMAEAIAGLLTDPKRGRAIGRRAQEWVRQRYDFDRSMAVVLETYARLTERG